MSRSAYIILVIVLGSLTAIEALAIDSSLPVLPAIAKALAEPNSGVQISLGMFMTGVAIGQLIYGPASDRYGRKPVMMIALVLFIAGSLLSTMAGTAMELTAARFLQGLGASAGNILARSVVRDRYDREAAAKLISWIALILAIAPIAAPILGAELAEIFGWEAVFVMHVGYGIAVLAMVVFLLQESLAEKDTNAMNVGRIVQNYREVLSSRVFWGNTLCNVGVFIGLFAFLAGSPFVIIDYLGVSATNFGYIFALTMVGHLLALIAGGQLVQRYGMAAFLKAGVLLAFISGLATGLLGWFAPPSVLALIVPVFLFMTAFALVLPSAIAGALSPFPHIAGAASSLLGFLQLGAGAVTGALIGVFSDGTQVALTTAVLIAGFICLIAWGIILPNRGRAPAPAE